MGSSTSDARLIAVVVTAVVFGAAAPAVTGGQSQTTSIDQCTTIDQSGTYELSGPIQATDSDTCIEVTADDVVLAGNGHTIDGGEATDGTVGVYVSSSDNTQIQNLIVSGWGTGIATDYLSNGSINAVTAVDNTVGIKLGSSRDVVVNSAVVRSNERWGVAFTRSTSESSIRGGRVYGNGQDLYVLAAGGNEISSVSLGESTRPRTTVTATTIRDVSIEAVGSLPSPPDGQRSIGRAVEISPLSSNTGVSLTLSYRNDDVSETDEQSLRIWNHGGTQWTRVGGSVDTEANTVTVPLDGSDFPARTTTFAVLGDSGPVQTPTDTPTSTPEPTETPTDTQTRTSVPDDDTQTRTSVPDDDTQTATATQTPVPDDTAGDTPTETPTSDDTQTERPTQTQVTEDDTPAPDGVGGTEPTETVAGSATVESSGGAPVPASDDTVDAQGDDGSGGQDESTTTDDQEGSNRTAQTSEAADGADGGLPLFLSVLTGFGLMVVGLGTVVAGVVAWRQDAPARASAFLSAALESEPEDDTEDEQEASGDAARGVRDLANCPDCGGIVGTNEQFCTHCGTQILSASGESEVEGSVPTTVPTELTLSIGNREIAVKDGTTVDEQLRSLLRDVGEADQAKWIDDDHLTFRRESDGFRLTTSGENLTRVNDERVRPGETTVVEPGDQIEVSGFLRLTVEG